MCPFCLQTCAWIAVFYILASILIRVFHSETMKKFRGFKIISIISFWRLDISFYRKWLYLVNKIYVRLGDCSLSTEHVMSLINMLLICYFDTISFSYFIQSLMMHELIQDIWLYKMMHVISIYVRYKYYLYIK